MARWVAGGGSGLSVEALRAIFVAREDIDETVLPADIGAVPYPSGGSDGQVLTKSGTGATWSTASGGGGADDTATKSDLRNWLAIGDSMLIDSEGSGVTVPGLLDTVLGPGVAVTADGRGGYTSTEIAIVMGAVDVTVGAFTIPAGTTATAVTVTAPTSDFRENGSGLFFARTGVLAGVPGTLTRNYTNGTWTFARTTAGSSVSVSAGSTFHCTEHDGHRGYATLIWDGRNGTSGTLDQTRILANDAAMVARLTPTTKRFLILSVLNNSFEASGSAGYNTVAAINAARAAAYGNRYLDVRSLLISSGLAFNNMTPTTQDNADIAAGKIPTSLKVDATHLNQFGIRAAVRFIADRLVALGWAPDALVALPAPTAPTLANDYIDGDFELGTAVVTTQAGTPANRALARSASASMGAGGGFGYRCTWSGADTAPNFYFKSTTVASPLAAHSAAIRVRASKAAQVALYMEFYNSSGVYLDGNYSLPPANLSANTETRLTLPNITPPANTAQISVTISAVGTWAAADTLDFDKVVLVPSATVPDDAQVIF